ncbi:MAG: hypothetical protein IPH04_11590 [Saprospirales bacterium]|jgi:hypothetical protein|nr:hypothetical protein [Saprospirales bacterium]MBK7336749.1 hypothetical protein [Saprospirales bacterium]
MKKSNVLPALVLLAFFSALAPAQAQKPKEKRSSGVSEYLEDKGNFASHLWYGGGFSLGFSGNNIYNVFNLGISPMVGYKIIEPLSIGPRASFQYTFIKGVGTDNQIHKVQPFSYSMGVFTRFKFFRYIFAHLEYELENSEYALVSPQSGLLLYDPTLDKILTQREVRDNLYLGAGYNSSGGQGFGFEILLLYNALNGSNSLDLPFLLRFGMTYKF